jgi:hypothetical protein
MGPNAVDDLLPDWPRAARRRNVMVLLLCNVKDSSSFDVPAWERPQAFGASGGAV